MSASKSSRRHSKRAIIGLSQIEIILVKETKSFNRLMSTYSGRNAKSLMKPKGTKNGLKIGSKN